MIGRLKGIVIEKQAPELLLDVNGVGYDVLAPMSTFYRLPGLGEPIVLHTHFVVREDAQQLYGFYDKQERALFRALIKVNGVGPKLALTILSGIEADEFVVSVHRGDCDALVRLPGVGKKTAERLIIEMKDRLKDWQQGDGMVTSIAVPIAPSANQRVADAESALVALGYKPTEAAKAIAKLPNDYDNSEDMIRAALKAMVNK
ncbi:MAG TPA: Holliday junction branch migration protein RuvA [Pseudomonadales bacterium]|nr:Holliday junction branch migration protein RuvA [Pseudomonadales bacterium]